MTRVRKQAAMRTIFALALAIPLALALVNPAVAAVGMPWPSGFDRLTVAPSCMSRLTT